MMTTITTGSTLLVVLALQLTATFAETFTGDGTAYTLSPPSAGNCNFMDFPDGAVDNYVAMNAEQYDGGHACGRCAEVWCTDPSCADQSQKALVYVMDKCPECSKGDLDISPSVFKQITGSNPSRLKISWRFVDCPVSGNLKICLKSGSNPFWTAVQPANMVTGVQSIVINGKEPSMVPSAYYYKVETDGGLDLASVKVSLSSVSGETIHQVVDLTGGGCVSTKAQFSSSGASAPEVAPKMQASTTTTSPPTTPPLTTPTPATTAPPTTEPPTTAPPPTEPPTTAPLTTEPPTTAPLTTEPPTTAPPTTEPPTTAPPTTEPPTTAPPTTEPPTTAPPTTEPPTTAPFTTEPPTTAPPTTEPPTTAPSTTQPTTTAPPTTESVTLEPTTAPSTTSPMSTPASTPSLRITGSTSSSNGVQEIVTKSDKGSAFTSPLFIIMMVLIAILACVLIFIAVKVKQKQRNDKEVDLNESLRGSSESQDIFVAHGTPSFGSRSIDQRV